MRYQNQSTHSKIMKHIIVFLLTVALFSFSIVTGRAEQPTELPSGTYNLSLTSESGGKSNYPVRLTTKINTQKGHSSGDRAEVVTDIVVEADYLGKLVGQTAERYDKGEFFHGYIVLSMTLQWPEGHYPEIMTYHLLGNVSKHSATGEGASFRDSLLTSAHENYQSKTDRFKWTLTPTQRQD
jgi:hypothetical protein